MKNELIAAVCIAALALSACSMEDPEPQGNAEKVRNDEELADYVKTAGIEAVKTPRGYYYQVLEESGSNVAVEHGNFVAIYYKLYTMNGRAIDSLTSEMGPPLRFRHYVTDLSPKAINEGMAYMNEGDRYRFLIPSYMAYWNLEIDTLFPAYSNIIAEVHVTDVTDSAGQVNFENRRLRNYVAEHYDESGYPSNHTSGVFYRHIKGGEGKRPSTGQTVHISYSRKLLNGKEVDEGKLKFKLGEHPVKGLNIGVAAMKPGEKARLIIPSYLAYWDQALNKEDYEFYSTARVIPDKFAPEIIVPPYSTLLYDLELLKIE